MIRVLIERRLAAGAEDVLQGRMRDLRREAIHRPGYISGETLRDVNDPGHYMILSSWLSVEAWNRWAASEQRRKIEDAIGDLLVEPERVTVYEVA